jgi:hypothetical protein
LPSEPDGCCEVVEIVIDRISKCELLFRNIKLGLVKDRRTQMRKLGSQTIISLSPNYR